MRRSAETPPSPMECRALPASPTGATREFVTTFGLMQPGVRVSFKVYVILNTGNEAGSATVVIQRPV